MEDISVKGLVEFLFSIDESGLLTPEVKRDVWNCGVRAKYGPQTLNYLNMSNIDELTFEDGSAANQIVDTLIQTMAIEHYLINIRNNPTLESLPRYGNLFKQIDLNPNALRALLMIEGKEGGRGVGKGEVFLASLFNDVVMKVDGKGDLNWDGLYLEVKGTSARLGGRDVPYTDFESSPLGILAKVHGVANATALEDIITGVYNNGAKQQDVIHAVETFNSIVYPDHGDFSISDLDLSNGDLVRKYLTKSYFSHYINDEGVDEMIFINTKKSSPIACGNYRIFSAAEMADQVDKGLIGCGRIKLGNLYPCIQSPKIK